MVNGRTTYGEQVDIRLGRIIGDQRASEFGLEVQALLEITNQYNQVLVGEDQPVRLAAALLLSAAGYLQHFTESGGELFVITVKGTTALVRIHR